MQIFFILGIPAVLSLGVFLFKKIRTFAVVNALGYLAVFFLSGWFLWSTVSARQPLSFFDFLYLDSLSAFFVFVISVVTFAAALYSIDYVEKDIEHQMVSPKKARLYYMLFNLFCFSMFVVPSVDNLGMLWVSIEMTTLISAFLVGFYNTKESVEAAWKYLMICSVGIIFALLGTILFTYAFSLATGDKSLHWTQMMAASGRLDHNIVKVAFIFILVGYGTKAGLAPMHTWLPDAHSQAVAPISALLSGVLLKTAVYAIVRFGTIVIGAVGLAYFCHLLIFFGMISLIVSSFFIVAQKDLKRLLAYSSIEHIGIIAIGLGVGTPLSWMGALLHVFNHAVTKSLMFFGAGHVVRYYRDHHMSGIRGVTKAMPFTGTLMLLGVFALTGFPPFSIFISEILIIIAAFIKGSYAVTALLLLFLAVIFGAFIHHFGEMLFGNLPKNMAAARESLSGKAAFLFLLILMCAIGVVLPWITKDVIWIVQTLFQV